MKDNEKQIEICEICKKRNNCNHRKLIHHDSYRVNDCDCFEAIPEEKQIEEMKNNARIYIGAVVEKLRMDGCELWEIDGIVENILNYITVPENSVVLTKEEYQKDFSSQFNKGYQHGSKETAEKILNELYHREEMGFETIKWYAKEYWGIEIKE